MATATIDQLLDEEARAANAPVIFISDYRPIQIGTAHKIAEYYEQRGADILIITSDQSLEQGDYGDNVPAKKRQKIWKMFKNRWPSVCVEKEEAPVADDPLLNIGIMSSAISISRSENIDEEADPALFDKLKKLAKGAVSASYHAKNADIIYIFNGRTASTLPLRVFADHNHIPTRFYEAGFALGRVYPFPPHQTHKYASLIDLYWNQYQDNNAERFSKAYTWIANKFKNPFTISYSTSLNSTYEAVFFVGSNDEYSSIYDRGWDHPFNDQIGVLRAIRRLFSNGAIAVRGHPNMKNSDKNFERTLKSVAQELNCDYFDSDNPVDSYSLILAAKNVCVDMSSIAVEAAAIGRRVLVFGAATFRGTVGDVVLPNLELKKPVDEFGLAKYAFFSSNYGFELKKQVVFLAASFDYKIKMFKFAINRFFCA